MFGIAERELFQSTSLSRGKTMWRTDSLANQDFQSTSLSRGKTERYEITDGTEGFQSTSLSRGKTSSDGKPSTNRSFQSTSLSRGKTTGTCSSMDVFCLSIHFPLTREDNTSFLIAFVASLSIHFPLTREDIEELGRVEVTYPFNPLPSHEGRPGPRRDR